MSQTQIYVLVFICATGAVLSIVWLLSDYFSRTRGQLSRRVNELTCDEFLDSEETQSLFQKDFYDNKQRSWWQKCLNQATSVLKQIGIKLPLWQFNLIVILAAIVIAIALYQLTGKTSLAIITGTGVPFLAFAVVWRKYKKQKEMLVQQLPEAFDLMSRTIRAGQTITSAMRIVSKNVPAPLSDHFRVCCEQQSLGIPFDKAVEELGKNINLLESRMFCVALLLQRQVGGNPAEMMEKLSMVMKRRLALEAKVKALTSEGRMQAIALTMLPVASFLLIYFIDPDYTQRLLDVPWLFWGTAISMLVGGFWIQKIVQIEY